ncbi:dihydrolipoyl dehydrogenase family protein [Natrarchaeobaculum aegyptiacum]|uniref:Dihydrolipoamide dehydrogenase n=1 Tax=Natrarchaeobaculum aegyptiacum TaxID=745377 RepID=A0A2Z2HXV5_9EURY|nr:dihydrolipoyl dehydrogenase [Natrarchaeobaculum aegyptiacum]ARS89824.1 dihydrolipoamide dehydrogenase [Natrarchaeobaculum aegyptiacum]
MADGDGDSVDGDEIGVAAEDDFDVVVIGGGSGSQVATAAAGCGLETAVIEPGPLGGACITRGCVPSKALLQRAEVAETIRRAGRFGLEASLESVDYGAITAAVHDLVYEKADRQERSLEDADGVTLFRGEGRFVDERTVAIDPVEGGDDDGPRRIQGEHVVIAVGSRPTTPPIDGLEDVDFLTSDDALFLEEQPDSLAVVGGGYVGAELAYFFAALGTEVTVVGRSDRLVPREDEAVSVAVTESLENRCDLYTGYEAAAVSQADGTVTVTAEPVEDTGDGDDGHDEDADPVDLEADALLVAAGRTPNTDTLDLENAGIGADDEGYLETDDRLETGAENVWALGDVLGAEPYKHAADYEAEIVAANVLTESGVLPETADLEREVDYRAMPHAIFTSPEAASVGQTEDELEESGREFESTRVSYDAAPKGLLLDLEAGEAFVKVLSSPDGEILGCHVVGPDAASLLQEVVVAMERGGGTVDDVAGTVHVHPALNEVVLAAFEAAADRDLSTAPDWRDVAGDS